jgi:hypothetical protein
MTFIRVHFSPGFLQEAGLAGFSGDLITANHVGQKTGFLQSKLLQRGSV